MKTNFTIIMLLLLTGQAWAGQPLTLKESISLALQKNNLVKAAGFSASAAGSGIEVVKSRYYPTLSFEENFTTSNSATQNFMMKLDQGRFTQNDFQISNLNQPSSWSDFRTTLSFQQPLYAPSQNPLKEMAIKDYEKSRLELEAIRQDVAFQVFRLYLEVQKSDARLKAAEKAVADARENMRLATVRNAAGVGLLSDELRARTHQSILEQQFISAHNNLALARMRLAMLIGIDEGQLFDLSSLPNRISVPVLNDDLVRTAIEENIEMKLSRSDLEKSGVALKLAKSSYYPTVGAFAAYQLSGKEAPLTADNNAWMAGINFKWQLFEGFRSNHERSRAASAESANREIVENRAKEARYRLKESYLRRDETGKRLEVARHALLDAEETVRLISKRFENSLATMLDLLDAQNALNQTRADLVETEAAYLLAGGRVYLEAGTFLKEMLK